MLNEYLYENFEIDLKATAYVNSVEPKLKDRFEKIDSVKEYNQYKVISAFHRAKLASTDFSWTTGYGYGDQGREKVETIYADIFKTEDALVRPSIASGTHALSLTLSGLLRPGDHLLSASGTPYDTMQQVVGVVGNLPGCLIDYGVEYSEVPLVNNLIDVKSVVTSIKENTKVVMIQRSTGYSDRRAFSIREIEETIKAIKEYDKDIIVMVDNCYGEFVEDKEPTEVGADIMAGSLIKNPGGGIALAGGYIVGRENLVEMIANRLTAPGLGKDCGLTFGTTRTTLQGLFLAPHVVAEAVKGAILVANVFSSLGYDVVPKLDDPRSDIIQAIKFGDPKKVVEFCKGIQQASAVDSYFAPEAWDMPGYEDKVIMAAGGFIAGSSIELSADGPMREPYFAYYQGGLTYEHCKLGVLKSLSNLVQNNLITLPFI